MQCKKCQSGNCKTFKIIHTMGTSSVSNSATWGSATAKTDLAKECEPPADGTGCLMLIALAVALPALPIGCTERAMKGVSFPSNIGIGFLYAIGVFIAVMLIFMFLSRVLGFTKRYERNMDEWSRSWRCLDCGHAFLAHDDK